MPKPQKRNRARRGLKTSLNKERVGQRFTGWRASSKGKRLGTGRVHFNAWKIFRKKKRMGRKRSLHNAWQAFNKAEQA